MMLTIHGLPTSTNYQDLKRLIKQECHITDFILDSLVMDDDGCKKVRIGVSDDGEGSHLMKYLNGYHFQGHVIRVVPVGKVNQQNQGNFDARGGYQRNDYQQNNLGRPIPHDSHPRAAPWAPQGTQWSQPTAQAQNAFPQHPQTSNTFIHQQPRGFAPGGAPAQPQSYGAGYAPKPTVSEHPITIMKDNFQGPTPYQNQPIPQGHFQGPSHTQTSQWNPQVQAVKPQVFDKPASAGYNPTGFNDNRQMAPKQGIEGGYKDYDKDHRFTPRDPSPGRRMGRGSPGPAGPGRRTSPTGPGRRMSPTGPGRRMSPSGPGRRMSPSGPGRRMSPSGPGRRMSPTGPGRRISPTGPRRRMSPGPRRLSHDREMSPGRQMGGRGMSPRPGGPGSPHGRKMSPRRMSPGGYDRRMSPTGPRRVSPGPPGRRLSPSGSRRRMSPHGDPGRMSPPGRRMSPGRRESSPGRRMSPGRRRGSPGRRSPLLDEPGMREQTAKKRMAEEHEESLELDPENVCFSDEDLEDFNMSMDDEDCSDAPETGAQNEDAQEVNIPLENAPGTDEGNEEQSKDYTKQQLRKIKNNKFKKIQQVMKSVSGAARRRFKMMQADDVPWEQALEMCQKRWSQLPKGTNPKKRIKARIKAMKSAGELDEPDRPISSFEVNAFFLKSRKCARVQIQNATQMSESQTELLRKDMIGKIMKMKKGDAPRFDDYVFANGYLTISCRDKASQQWLVQTVPNLQPWSGAKLTATIVRVPTKPMILNLILPRSEVTDIAHAFSLLKAQNRGLNTEDWTLLAHRELKAGNLITVSIDERSAEALKETGYNACLGFKMLRFNRDRMQEQPKRPFYNKKRSY